MSKLDIRQSPGRFSASGQALGSGLAERSLPGQRLVFQSNAWTHLATTLVNHRIPQHEQPLTELWALSTWRLSTAEQHPARGARV